VVVADEPEPRPLLVLFRAWGVPAGAIASPGERQGFPPRLRGYRAV